MRCRPPARGRTWAIGVLETAIWPVGATTLSWKVALTAGSSQTGANRRASEFSNWLTRTRLGPVGET